MSQWVLIVAAPVGTIVGYLVGWATGYADRKRDEEARRYVDGG